MLKIVDAGNQRTAMQFIDEVLRRLPFRVHVVQSDNGAEFQSQFHWSSVDRAKPAICRRFKTGHINLFPVRYQPGTKRQMN